jgi:hypothetical protein
MEAPEHMPLADLKKAIKEFKTKDTPKLSSKKAILSEYASRVGILKAKAVSVAVGTTPAPAVPDALPEVLKAKKVKVAKEVVPVVAKAIEEKKKAKKAEPAPVASGKKTSPFALFMQAHKGKGYSMAQLAEMYKKGK